MAENVFQSRNKAKPIVYHLRDVVRDLFGLMTARREVEANRSALQGGLNLLGLIVDLRA